MNTNLTILDTIANGILRDAEAPANTVDVGAPKQRPMFEGQLTEVPTPARPEQPTWAVKGACRSDPDPDRWITLPDLRVHGVNNPEYREHVTELKTVCAGCTVSNACLYLALNSPERVDGIWGGTDEFERAGMLTAAGRSQPGPAGIAPLDGWDAAADLILADQFTAQCYAHQGYSNQQIATKMGSSYMTISRLLADKERTRGSRHKGVGANRIAS
jgi:Transcription factor WhiB